MSLRRNHPSRPRPAASAAWQQLVRVHGLMRRLSDPHFARYGMSSAQWGVVRALARLAQRGVREPRMHELGAELLVQPPSLSATLERMVRMGLVDRQVDPDDQRSRRVSLTRRGEVLLDGVLADHAAWVARMTAGLTPAEQERLDRLLRKLGAHLARMLHDPVSGAGGFPPRPFRKERGTA